MTIMMMSDTTLQVDLMFGLGFGFKLYIIHGTVRYICYIHVTSPARHMCHVYSISKVSNPTSHVQSNVFQYFKGMAWQGFEHLFVFNF